MTTSPLSSPSSSSTHHRCAGEEPVEVSGRSNQSSSTQAAGSTGIITGITAACRPPILPLPLSEPVRDKILTTNGEYENAVKASSPSREEIPPGLLSPQLAISKPIENISSGSKPRRFSPQLVESTRRKRKSGDSGPAILPQDKTDVSPGTKGTLLQSLKSSASIIPPLPFRKSSVINTPNALSVTESRFSSSSLRKKAPRQHSFQVPELPSIQSAGDSEESNESNNPSTSATPFATSADNVSFHQATEPRKTDHNESEGYLLSLAARAAQNELREQAMAAYPNEKIHEPIDHFAVAREDGDGEDKAHVQGHNNEFSVMKDQQKTIATSRITPPRASQEQFHNHIEAAKDHNHVSGALKIDTAAGKAVSPALAGQDLQYPFCQSPIQTRFDTRQTYQGSEPSDLDLTEHSGLWNPEGGPSRKGSTHGLWMGTCAKSAKDSRSSTKHCIVQTGLLTPAAEPEHKPIRFSQCHHHPHHNKISVPLSPPDSDDDCKPKPCCATSALSDEEKISEEFPDSFITQVYNYLSLGYPSMARKFDAEISKITKVPIEALRIDDGNVNANGYVGAPERIAGGKEEKCPRWGALKKYVREWARQQSRMMGMGMEGVHGGGDWGQLAKKGSWAI